MAYKTTETFNVMGMSCFGCEAKIEELLRSLDGVKSVKGNFPKSTVTVTYDPGRTNIIKMRESLKSRR